MSQSNKMSVMQLTILTAVNMMGSGIIMLPTKLAQVGALSIVSWLVTAVGSMCLAYVFAKCGMYSKKVAAWAAMRNILLGKPVTSWLITPTAFLWFSQILRSPFLL